MRETRGEGTSFLVTIEKFDGFVKKTHFRL